MAKFEIVKCEIVLKLKIQTLQKLLTAIFDLLKSAKIDFIQNQRGGKIAKFPHCGISAVKFSIRLPWSVVVPNHCPKNQVLVTPSFTDLVSADLKSYLLCGKKSR